ncbi:MAG: NTP transferase domain-containing protein [Bacteroidales bacterium]|nr:NTP transferase domain-containing protein [Bacteroidales bacterium]
MKNDLGVIILAAGFSSRMRKSKAFLQFNNKLTFVEKIIKEYNDFGCEKIVIVLNQKDAKKAPNYDFKNAIIEVNFFPEQGRFSSIKLAINILDNLKYVFLQNIDNPFVNQEILQQIYENRTENAYISPVFNNKGGHPILLHQNIIAQIQTQFTKNQNFKEILQPFNRKNVLMFEDTVLININTNEEYIKHKNP